MKFSLGFGRKGLVCISAAICKHVCTQRKEKTVSICAHLGMLWTTLYPQRTKYWVLGNLLCFLSEIVHLLSSSWHIKMRKILFRVYAPWCSPGLFLVYINWVNNKKFKCSDSLNGFNSTVFVKNKRLKFALCHFDLKCVKILFSQATKLCGNHLETFINCTFDFQ